MKDKMGNGYYVGVLGVIVVFGLILAGAVYHDYHTPKISGTCGDVEYFVDADSRIGSFYFQNCDGNVAVFKNADGNFIYAALSVSAEMIFQGKPFNANLDAWSKSPEGSIPYAFECPENGEWTLNNDTNLMLSCHFGGWAPDIHILAKDKILVSK